MERLIRQRVRNKESHFPPKRRENIKVSIIVQDLFEVSSVFKSREYTPPTGPDNEPSNSNSVVVASRNPTRDKKQPSFLSSTRYLGFVHGRGAALASVGLGGLGLGNTLGQDLGVLVLYAIVLAVLLSRRRGRSGWITYGLVLDLLGLAALECDAVALVLQTLGSDQTLDLGGLGVRLGALLLGLDLSSDDVLADLYPGGEKK